MPLDDLVRHVTGAAHDGAPLVEFLLERADRILAAETGRERRRMLTDAEIDRLLARDEPRGAA